MTQYLTAAAILAASDLAIVEKTVPEWGGKVRIRAWSLQQQDDYEQAEKLSDVDALVLAIIMSLVDEAGAPIFKPEHAEGLKAKSSKVLTALTSKIFEVNRQDEKALETEQGN